MEPWQEPAGEEHQAAYRRIVERLRGLAADNQAALERFRDDLRLVLRNEEATRRLLAEEVYRVPDEWLDELLRVRLEELRGGG
jgi:hypothetical protein